MIVKQGNNFTTPKIFKKVCQTLLVTVTILSPNLLLNDCCFKIIVDTRTVITENFHMTKVTFLHHFCRWALTFSYSNMWAHCFICSTYVTSLRHHVDVKTSLALPYMANCAKVYWQGRTCKTVFDGGPFTVRSYSSDYLELPDLFRLRFTEEIPLRKLMFLRTYWHRGG